MQFFDPLKPFTKILILQRILDLVCNFLRLQDFPETHAPEKNSDVLESRQLPNCHIGCRNNSFELEGANCSGQIILRESESIILNILAGRELIVIYFKSLFSLDSVLLFDVFSCVDAREVLYLQKFAVILPLQEEQPVRSHIRSKNFIFIKNRDINAEV